MNIPLLVVIIGLIILSAFFSCSEAALFSLSHLQLHKLKKRRDRTSRSIQLLRQNSEQTLSSLLVGNNLVNIALSSIATIFFIDLLEPEQKKEAVELSALVVTVLVLIFGETTPKTFAVNFSVGASRLFAGGVLFGNRILAPLIWAIHGLAMLILRSIGFEEETSTQKRLISRSELRALLEDVDEDSSVITRNESRMVQNILDFSRRTAEQIMTPRVDVEDIDINADLSSWAELMRESRHSRLLVFEDDPDNVIGFIPAKEYLLNTEREIREVREIIRPVVFFPENATVDALFSEIQRARTAMVVVVNEYGETAGLITREDMIEEIVGDIYDEFDMEDVPIRKKSDGLYLVHGRTDLSDLTEELNIDFSDESSITLNGFLCEVYGHIPRPGTIVNWRDLRFHVLEVARHQVRKVLIELPDRKEDNGS